MVNAMVGTKVAITSNRPQTTRSAIRGIVNLPDAQIVLIDTPGYHKPKTLLGKRLNQVVRAAWADVDLALFLVDGKSGIGAGDELVAGELAAAAGSTPRFCIVNKIDFLNPSLIAATLQRASEIGDFDEFVPVSAMHGEGVEVLRNLIVERLQPGPSFYPEGASSDQPPSAFVAELVREKLLTRTRDELPHSIAVVTEEYEEREDGLLSIKANIFVERESQKGMVVGKGGAVIKAAGTEAREELEVLFGRRIFLDLRVKVEKDWQRRAIGLDRMGFNDEL